MTEFPAETGTYIKKTETQSTAMTGYPETIFKLSMNSVLSIPKTVIPGWIRYLDVRPLGIVQLDSGNLEPDAAGRHQKITNMIVLVPGAPAGMDKSHN